MLLHSPASRKREREREREKEREQILKLRDLKNSEIEREESAARIVIWERIDRNGNRIDGCRSEGTREMQFASSQTIHAIVKANILESDESASAVQCMRGGDEKSGKEESQEKRKAGNEAVAGAVCGLRVMMREVGVSGCLS